MRAPTCVTTEWSSVLPCVRVSMRPCLRASVRPCFRASVLTCVCACMRSCVYLCIREYTHVRECVHVRTNTYIHLPPYPDDIRREEEPENEPNVRRWRQHLVQVVRATMSGAVASRVRRLVGYWRSVERVARRVISVRVARPASRRSPPASRRLAVSRSPTPRRTGRRSGGVTPARNLTSSPSARHLTSSPSARQALPHVAPSDGERSSSPHPGRRGPTSPAVSTPVPLSVSPLPSSACPPRRQPRHLNTLHPAR